MIRCERMKRALPVAIACLVAALGCQSNSDQTQLPTTPTEGTTETFSGTVNVGGESINPFTIALSGGLLTVTLTAAGPPSTVEMGILVGTWDGTACTQVTGGTVITRAGTAPQLSGNVNAGRYCVRVFDPGNLSAPVTFAVSVVHY